MPRNLTKNIMQPLSFKDSKNKNKSNEIYELQIGSLIKNN